jgi:flagellar motility protein MotE (MotC chaperone)
MKRVWNVLVLTLALNFVVFAVALAYVYRTANVDQEKVRAIKAILFPLPAEPKPTTRPAATTQPTLKLEELLARSAGRPPAEQLDYIRQSFDSQMAQLDRAHRALIDLQRQVKLAQEKLAADRVALEQEKKDLAAQKGDAERLAADKGFQDSLALYETMPAKQVKTLLMGMDDETVNRYLQAMEPRTAAKITKEFKAPDEVERLKHIMERMRQPPPQAQAVVKE